MLLSLTVQSQHNQSATHSYNRAVNSLIQLLSIKGWRHAPVEHPLILREQKHLTEIPFFNWFVIINVKSKNCVILCSLCTLLVGPLKLDMQCLLCDLKTQ